MHACSGKTWVPALQLASARVFRHLAQNKEGQPSDNMFLNNQAQTQSSYCKHTSETYLEYQEIFPTATILFCAYGISSAGSSDFACA